MGWFTRQSVEVETAPSETTEERSQQNLRELREVKDGLAAVTKEIAAHLRVHKDRRVHVLNGNLFTRVNAMSCDPRLQSLEARRAELLRKHWALLDYAAKLKKAD